jgi:predicted amidohydrolase
MKIAAAQICPIENNINANIKNHLRMIKLAAEKSVDLIFFPEMSLSAYEREKAKDYSFQINDSRLDVFKAESAKYQMLIIVGAAIEIESELYIGSFIFQPDGSTLIYTKQFLHDGEEQFFSSGNKLNPQIEWKGEKISLAICADISHPVHAENASKINSTIYLPGIFYTPNGIAEAYKNLSNYAEKYKMNIVMANYVGSSYSLEAAGQSAFWNNKGELVSQLDGKTEGLLIADIE